MSNKTQLQTNNTNLSNLIETLRGKASGGSVETCTLTINCTATSIGKVTLHYIDTNGEYQTYSSESGSISLLKNSMIYVSKDGANCKFSTQGGLTLLYSPDTISSIFKINEDATISFSYGGGSD